MTVDSERVFESTVVRVFVEFGSFEARPLPEDCRRRLAAYDE